MLLRYCLSAEAQAKAGLQNKIGWKYYLVIGRIATIELPYDALL
jgi:hypothetical protein